MTQRVFKKGQVWLYEERESYLIEVKITDCKGDYIQFRRNDLFDWYGKEWAEGSEFNKNAKQLIKDVE